MAQSLFREDTPAEEQDARGWIDSYHGDYPPGERMAADCRIKCGGVTMRPNVIVALQSDLKFLVWFVARQAMAKRVCPKCFGIGGNGKPCHTCRGTGFTPLPPAERRDAVRLAVWEWFNGTGLVVDDRDPNRFRSVVHYEAGQSAQRAQQGASKDATVVVLPPADLPEAWARTIVDLNDAELAYALVYAASRCHDKPPAYWVMWCWNNIVAWRQDRPPKLQTRDTFTALFGWSHTQSVLVHELASGMRSGYGDSEWEHLKPLGFPRLSSHARI